MHASSSSSTSSPRSSRIRAASPVKSSRSKIWALTGHTGAVAAVAVGELDGRPILVSGSRDNTVRVWDMGTRGNPRVIRLGVPVHSVTKPKNGFVVAAHPTGLTALRL